MKARCIQCPEEDRTRLELTNFLCMSKKLIWPEKFGGCHDQDEFNMLI